MREEAQRIAGRLEGTLRMPDTKPTAIVVIAHPLPTHSGSMRNPLMATVARAVAHRGWYALRFNFRGVGASEGEWSGGHLEHEDLADAVAHARAIAPALPLGAVGFSFGASMVLEWVARGGDPDAFVLMGLSLRTDPPPVPDVAVIVNGEDDEYGDPREIARRFPRAKVITILGTDHFFTGKRDEAARIVVDHLPFPVP